MKLKNAAHNTAQCGFNTRVETTAAIEFAASWKPFKKSKNSAKPMVTMTKINVLSRLGIFKHNALNDIANVLAAINNQFGMSVNFFQFEKLFKVVFFRKQLAFAF